MHSQTLYNPLIPFIYATDQAQDNRANTPKEAAFLNPSTNLHVADP